MQDHYRTYHAYNGSAYAIHCPRPEIPGLPAELQLHVHKLMHPTIVVNRGLQLHVYPFGHILTGHTMAITALQLDPTGTTLLSASYDKTMRLWHNWRVKVVIKAPGPVVDAVFYEQTQVACLTNAAFMLFRNDGVAVRSVPLLDPRACVRTYNTAWHTIMTHGQQIGISLQQDQNDQISVFDMVTGVRQVKHNNFHTLIADVASDGNLMVAVSMNRAYCYKFDDPEYVRYISLPVGQVTATAINKNYIAFLVDERVVLIYTRRYQRKHEVRLQGNAFCLCFGIGDTLLALCGHSYYHKIEADRGIAARIYIR